MVTTETIEKKCGKRRTEKRQKLRDKEEENMDKGHQKIKIYERKTNRFGMFLCANTGSH
jgi:hypothetical protein